MHQQVPVAKLTAGWSCVTRRQKEYRKELSALTVILLLTRLCKNLVSVPIGKQEYMVGLLMLPVTVLKRATYRPEGRHKAWCCANCFVFVFCVEWKRKHHFLCTWWQQLPCTDGRKSIQNPLLHQTKNLRNIWHTQRQRQRLADVSTKKQHQQVMEGNFERWTFTYALRMISCYYVMGFVCLLACWY